MDTLKFEEAANMFEVNNIVGSIPEIHLNTLSDDDKCVHSEIYLTRVFVSAEKLPSWEEMFRNKLEGDIPPDVLAKVKTFLIEVFNVMYKGLAEFDEESFTLRNHYREGSTAARVLSHFYTVLETSLSEYKAAYNIEVDTTGKGYSSFKIPIKFDMFAKTNMAEMPVSKEAMNEIVSRSSCNNIILYDLSQTKFLTKDLFELK